MPTRYLNNMLRIGLRLDASAYTSYEKDPLPNVEFMIEFKALKEEVNMTYKVVAELKKEVMELKHILIHKKDKMSTKSQLQEVTIESVQEINESVNEEIDINFNDYLQMLRKKKTHGINLNQLTDDVWYG